MAKESICPDCGTVLSYVKLWPEEKVKEYYCKKCKCIRIYENGRII